jgi:hypothetical protein
MRIGTSGMKESPQSKAGNKAGKRLASVVIIRTPDAVHKPPRPWERGVIL